MANYTKTTDFAAKDTLPGGDTNKVVRGAEFETEFDAISTAIATKSDTASPTFTGTVTVPTADINGGNIDGTVIGASTAAAGTFTNLTATGTVDFNGATVSNLGTITTANLDGGTVDNSVIGGATPAAGTFTNLTANTSFTSGNVDINGGAIDGTPIGASSTSTVAGTTGTFSGAVTGSNLNVSNWDTAYGWGDHSVEGYLTSVAFSDLDAGAVTTSGETFANSDTQLPTNAAVRNWVLTTYPTIVELNDLTANVTWANVPDANITQTSVTQHQAALAITASQLSDVTSTAAELNILDGVTATTAELNYVDGVTSNIQTQIDSISPSPTLTATASGAIADGDKIIVNSDGTVTKAQTTSLTQAVGTSTTIEEESSLFFDACYDSNAQKVVIVYRRGSDSYPRAVVATVSDTSISFGTITTITSAYSDYFSVAFDENSGKVVFACQTNSNAGKAFVGTVSGTSISFGSAVTFNNASSIEIDAVYDATAKKIVLAYRDGGNSNYGTAVVGTVSGSSISFGSEAVFNSAATNQPALAFDANAGKTVIGFRDFNDALKACVATISGTSLSYGSATQWEGEATDLSATYDSSAQKVIFAYQDFQNSRYGTAAVATVSGTGISFGTPVVFESARSQQTCAAYHVAANKTVIGYVDQPDNQHGKAVVGTVSGTSISFTSPTTFHNQSFNTSFDVMAAAYDADAKRIVFAHTEGGFPTYATATVFRPAFNDPNLTAENYIGIADGAYSDSATATIQIVGSVDDAQTGLTAGQKYYVQTDGSLGLTADDPEVFAGTAVSATKLIVKG